MIISKPTKHAIIDREDRLLFIATTIGFGNIVAEKFIPEKDSWNCLTDTGVIIVKSHNKQQLVTAYVATFSQATKICELSYSLKNTIARNHKKGYDNYKG